VLAAVEIGSLFYTERKEIRWKTNREEMAGTECVSNTEGSKKEKRKKEKKKVNENGA